jgi:hypothetical protein
MHIPNSLAVIEEQRRASRWPPAAAANKKVSLPERVLIESLFGGIAAERLGCGWQTLDALASTTTG